MAQQKGESVFLKPLPISDPDTKGYWEALTRHELVIQRCLDCGCFVHPPQPNCPCCLSKNREWEKLSGDGNVYTFTITHYLAVPGFEEPYILAVVEPIEAKGMNVRIIANVVDCPIEKVRVGMPVKAVFQDTTQGITLLQFSPVDGA